MKKIHKVALQAFNEKQNDWYGTCRKCHKMLKGTLKELTEHKCEPSDVSS